MEKQATLINNRIEHALKTHTSTSERDVRELGAGVRMRGRSSSSTGGTPMEPAAGRRSSMIRADSSAY